VKKAGMKYRQAFRSSDLSIFFGIFLNILVDGAKWTILEMSNNFTEIPILMELFY
jgi:hypothetical protein